ncbi:MAG TPA: FlgD immunoglobulin-like domain containing protein, partial [Flavisolibacter sp.]|nr:FlgD immunoglobulin-like domain containing protein [Flavisolibacter sp.]
SYPDDKGNILLVNHRGEVVDEVAYDQKWHFALLSDKNGVALERIDPEGPSQDKHNWHSAAATAGYGTPGYRNSQYRLVDNLGAQVEVYPKLFSPDSDGFDDLAFIQYALTESGFVANVTIFDVQGRPVRQLVRNALLGRKGTWTWDGLNNEGKALASGTYIIFTELFNLQGKKKTVKQTIVLARR